MSQAEATWTGDDELREWGVRSFDPWDGRITSDNAWGMYRAMRDAAPAVHSDAHGGFWAITRYEDVKAAAADPATFSSAQGTVVGRRKDPPSIPLEFDRPEHTRYRKALQAPFLRSRVEQFTDLVRAEVAALMDRITEAREFDIVGDLAALLPLGIISEFLGITGERQTLHQRLGHEFVHARIDTVAAAEEAYYGFIREEVRARVESPGSDFISELVQTEVEGRRFEEQEIVRMTRALALAGHHTTINGIAAMLVRLAEPDTRRRLLDGTDTPAQVVEETLRIDPPIHLEARTTTRAVDVSGAQIPAGQKVALLYGSGNHDERVYADPERFDAARQGPGNLTFGHGVHKCLGQHLSLLEMTVVAEQMLERFPDYQLVGPRPLARMVYGHHMAWTSVPAVIR